MKTNTMILLGIGAVVAVWAISRNKAAANAASPGNPFAGSIASGSVPAARGGVPNALRLSSGSVLSATIGASRGMILPNAAAAQRDTELYGYGSGS